MTNKATHFPTNLQSIIYSSKISNRYEGKFVVSENISKLLLTNHKIKSLNLIDSNITSRAMSNIRKALKDPRRHLISLSFKFSYLDTKNMFLLCDGLQVNRTLCK
jgi:hypothetical protein